MSTQTLTFYTLGPAFTILVRDLIKEGSFKGIEYIFDVCCRKYRTTGRIFYKY